MLELNETKPDVNVNENNDPVTGNERKLIEFERVNVVKFITSKKAANLASDVWEDNWYL